MTSPDKYKSVSLLGARITDLSMTEALDAVDAFVADGSSHIIITANVDHLMQLRHNAAFQRAYANADLVTCDSIPLKWALSFLGQPVKERVAGADMLFTIAERAAARGYRLFYLGAAPGVAAAAATAMTERYPGLNVVGTYAPPIMPLEELIAHEETRRRVREARPDILFVAFGAPKQELWLTAVRDELGVPVALGIGAALDFAAGTVKRAPRWMQSIGAEWLWRLLQEPKRLWRRYLFVDTRFIFYVLHKKLRGGGRGESRP